ncbi:MAG: hypothetical protein CSA81_11945 [Acidobacteria bacterium]|nr:MAG: hypothetical protein CSA81_11945 [Acidobacteriota bacterium]
MSGIKWLGKYQILGIIGRGSMGIVYKGMDPRIKKLVAIKTMNPKNIADSLMEKRFYREGSILGQLNHKNIVDVYNVGEDKGISYIAMEYLEGTTLDEYIKTQPKLSLKAILKIVKQICKGVQMAHSKEIIHRDIKPANIFILDNDHVKVLDFGVAHFKNSKLTTSGMVIGTINYISPEQITGLKVDHRADIFSIGVILYELIAGKNPFIGKNISQTMINIINRDPEPLSNVPEPLSVLIDKMLTKDRDKRVSSCEKAAEELEAIYRTEALLDTIAEETTLDDEVLNAKQSYIRKLVAEKMEQINKALESETLSDARHILAQLSALVPQHGLIKKLQEKIRQREKEIREREVFYRQLAHGMLKKANELMTQRCYVKAIEVCEKVLTNAPQDQDAKIIKATCVKQLEIFLKKRISN